MNKFTIYERAPEIENDQNNFLDFLRLQAPRAKRQHGVVEHQAKIIEEPKHFSLSHFFFLSSKVTKITFYRWMLNLLLSNCVINLGDGPNISYYVHGISPRGS